ncbi:MAG: tetratricopeptide repeat protein [bacterium]
MQAELKTGSPVDTRTQEILALVQAGKDLLSQGDLNGALNRFEAVVNQFPERPEGHNNLGALYTSLGQFAKAERCFSQVLQLLPDNTNVRYNRGVVLIRLQRYADAIIDFEIVLKSAPEDADCWNNLGVATFLKGDYASARLHFQRALDLVPNYPNAILNLCDTEVAAGNRSRAIAACEEYLRNYTDLDINQKMLEMMFDESHDLLTRACRAAEAIPQPESLDASLREHIGQLQVARKALQQQSLAAVQ